MTISNAVKHFEVRHTRLSSTPDFLRCFLVQLGMWTSILHIDGTLHYFYLELLRHVLVFQHCSNHVKNGSIYRLNYSILLGEYGAVRNLLIPCSSQYFMSSDEMNSLPRSDLTYLIGMTVSFSTIALNLLNTWNTSNFSFKNTPMFFLKNHL